ncbi:MAG: hypothetical protein RBR50_10860 [Candidatus Izemoplasmatales bacterium]|nr:hypothetical protein [Candidatus Izemoplasmatales bacterium]
MILCLFGESCTGKTSLLNLLKKQRDLSSYNGKDYLKLAKTESEARIRFQEILNNTSENELVVYVTTEKEDLQLLPKNTIRVYVTASLEVIKERFSMRMHGNLPKPVEMMLEKKHGTFDQMAYNVRLSSMDLNQNLEILLNLIDTK